MSQGASENKSSAKFWLPLAGAVLALSALAIWAAAAGFPSFSIPTESKSHAEVALPDWPDIFGPYGNYTYPPDGLETQWDSAGPPKLWQKQIGTGYSVPVGIGDDLIVFHREADEEVLECLDAATGNSRWAVRYGTKYQCPFEYSSGPYSTPAIAAGKIVAFGAEGKIHCAHLTDGEVLWSRDLYREYQVEPGMYAAAVSPLIADGLVILNVGGTQTEAGIVALDLNTGATRWTATSDGASCATARRVEIHGQPFLFVFTAQGLVSLDPRSGTVDWSIEYHPKNSQRVNATSPLIDGDLVLVTGYHLGALCVQVLPDRSYEELWRRPRTIDSQYNNLVSFDGCALGFSALEASLRCVELSSGEVLWKLPSVLDRGNSIAIGETLLVLSEQGYLGAVRMAPLEGGLLWATDEPVVAGPCYSAPSLHGGRLYLRADRELVCFDLAAD